MRRAFVLPVVVFAFVVAGCSSSDSESGADDAAPTSVEGAATATDPVNTITPTSSAAKDDPATGTPATESVTITVDLDTDDLPVLASVNVGSPVTIIVTGSESHEFHLHGYDLELEGPSVEFGFTADRVGDFELETHDTDEVVVQLSVVAD